MNFPAKKTNAAPTNSRLAAQDDPVVEKAAPLKEGAGFHYAGVACFFHV